jgi:predicted PurR-regulated permease PerM
LEKKGIRRLVSLTLGVILLVVLLSLTGYFFVPPFVNQIADIFSDFPRLWEQMGKRWNALHHWYPRLIPEFQERKLIEQLTKNIERFYPLARQFAFSLFSVVATSILVFFISIFGLYNPTHLKDCLLEAIPPFHREKAVQIGRRILGQLRSWIQGLLLAMLFVGILSYLGLLILNVKYALAFGVLSGLLEIVPYVGPILSAFLPAALTAMDDPLRVVYVLALFVIIQQVENHILIPLIMSRQLTLHPLGVIFFFLVMTYLLGFFGTFVAVPTYACVAILYEELYLEKIRTEGRGECQEEG